MVNKQIEVYLYNGILKIKRSELWIHAIMWMNHQNIILNETSQTKKIYGFYLYEIQEKVKQVYEYSDRKLSSGFLRLEAEGIG